MQSHFSQNTVTTLLLVDDIATNLLVLLDFLSACGFETLIAQDGESALQRAQFAVPDLILLDVVMPGIDGFETCRRLKSDPKTRDIPVIFMTALNDMENKIKGFEAGAVDYVTKPLQQEEVLARVTTHLTLRRLQKELQLQNERLDEFAHTVAHDLKNPLSAIIGFADLLFEVSGEQLDPESLEYLEDLRLASHKMKDIIEALLLLAGISRNEIAIQPLNMQEIVVEVQRRLSYLTKKYQAEITVSKNWPMAYGYAPWVEEIWTNYISYGLEFGEHPHRLELGATQMEDTVRFWVRDQGKGLTLEQQANLFARTKQNLALSIVRRVAERLQAQVGVESHVDQGNLFYFTLPSKVEVSNEE